MDGNTSIKETGSGLDTQRSGVVIQDRILIQTLNTWICLREIQCKCGLPSKYKQTTDSIFHLYGIFILVGKGDKQDAQENYSIFSSVQFSHSVVSDSLWPHESQHARPPCLSPTPGVHSDSCPSSRWCHPAISSSVSPFSSCPQSLPASGPFPMSQLFAWGGQSTGASALAAFLLWFFLWSCMDVRVGLWRRLSIEELMLLNCGVGEDSWESLGLQEDPTSPFWRRSTLGFLWKEWC